MYDVIHDSHYRGRGFFNFESTSRLPRHRWYYLKEGFSSSLVEEAIREFQQTGKVYSSLRVLEPFGGTGTTPLTAALNNTDSTAIEVNPFLAFTACVKTTTSKWQETSYVERLEQIISASTDGAYSPLEGFSTFTERENLTKWLFNKSVIRRFTSVAQAIDEKGGIYRDPLKLAAIVAAYNCGNAKRDGKALRYKANWADSQYSNDHFILEFKKHALLMLRDSLEWPISEKHQPVILEGDSRYKLAELEDSSFDLVVTSPPYLNSFDYSDIYRPELFLGGYVHSNEDLKEIRLRTIRSHVQVKWAQDVVFESTLLEPVVRQLRQSDALWNKNIPIMVEAYFDDIFKVFQLMKPKLRKGAKIWLVVSTSSFGGVHIPVDLIIADVANQAGYLLESIHCLRHLRSAGQQWKKLNTKLPPLRESLIILKV